MEQTLFEILNWLSDKNIFVVCAVIFAAAVLQFVFPPVPSDVLLVAIGISAATGTYNGVATLLSYSLGAFVGSFGLYLLCYHFGDKVRNLKIIKNLIKDDDLEKANLKIAKFGGPSLFIMRFIPALQVVALIAFGFANYPRRKMCFYAPAVAFFGSAVYFFIGYVLGGNLPKLMQILDKLDVFGWIALAVVVVVAVTAFLIFKFRKKQN